MIKLNNGLDMEALALWDLESLSKYFKELKTNKDRVKLGAYIDDDKGVLGLEIKVSSSLREEIELKLSMGDNYYNPILISMELNNRGLDINTNEPPAPLVLDRLFRLKFNSLDDKLITLIKGEDKKSLLKCIEYFNKASNELRDLYCKKLKNLYINEYNKGGIK